MVGWRGGGGGGGGGGERERERDLHHIIQYKMRNDQHSVLPH
jgi:hypothetical protein